MKMTKTIMRMVMSKKKSRKGLNFSALEDWGGLREVE